MQSGAKETQKSHAASKTRNGFSLRIITAHIFSFGPGY